MPLISRLRQSEYIRNISTLTSGTVIAQAIPLLVSPILSRLYTPDEFGIFAFYMSIVSAFAIIATLRYELAIIIPKSDEDALNVFGLSVLILLGISLTAFLGVIIFNFFVSPAIDIQPLLITWLYLLPVMILLLGMGNVFQNWFNRSKRYRILAIGKIVNSIGNNGIILLLGFIGTGAWGLLAGNIAGLILFNLLFLFFFLRKIDLPKGLISLAKMKELASEHRDLPTANTPQALLDGMQFNGIIYLLKILFNSTVIGWYSFAMRVLQAPMWLIGTSLAQVFYKDASAYYHDSQSVTIPVRRTLKFASVTGFPAVIALVFFGPALFGFVFGENWREAGVYAQILSPWIYMDFVRYSIAQAPLIVKKVKTMFIFSLIGNSIVVVSIFTGGLFLKDIKMTFLILSGLMVIYDLFIIGWIIQIAKQKKV